MQQAICQMALQQPGLAKLILLGHFVDCSSNTDGIFPTHRIVNCCMTDQEIIQGFLNGDNKCYKEVAGWITAAVRYLARHERLSPDDILGDTVEKLLVLFRDESFKGESSLKTFVQKITKYTIIDACRRPVVTRTHSLPENFDMEETESADREAIKNEEKDMHVRMLEIIDPKCRALWDMIFVDKLPYEVIAKKTGMSLAAVKVKVHRCKKEATRIVQEME